MKCSTAVIIAFAFALCVQPLEAQMGRPHIFIADANGTNVKLLVEIPEAGYHGSPNWSSDGKLILMNAMPRDRGFEQARIYACAVAGPFNGNIVDLGVGSFARFSP